MQTAATHWDATSRKYQVHEYPLHCGERIWGAFLVFSRELQTLPTLDLVSVSKRFHNVLLWSLSRSGTMKRVHFLGAVSSSSSSSWVSSSSSTTSSWVSSTSLMGSGWSTCKSSYLQIYTFLSVKLWHISVKISMYWSISVWDGLDWTDALDPT